MQRWPRSSQCIFCEFRARTRDGQSIAKKCNYATTRTTRSVKIDGSIERPTERPNHRPVSPKNILKALDRLPDAQRSRKDVIPAKYTRRSWDRDEPKDKSRQSEIERALRNVKKYLKTNKMSRSSDVSQLKGLDPDGILWPRYEALIVSSFVTGKESSKAPSGIVAEVMDSPMNTLRETAERAVRFGFLDFYLENTEGTNAVFKEIDLRYPTEWYPDTRMVQRDIHLHVGPTNSGKTYTALKRLEQAESGFYAGPLRLLAHEVYSRFNNRGIKCDLVTGDDIRLDESGGVDLYASTVEMVDSNKPCEVGVIDEIQMIGDEHRGWAWTRAVLAARAKELHLCGEARVVPLIREIVASIGDTLHIHQYERLSPLKVMSKSLKGSLKNLRPGDCVVSFSVVSIHALKRQIELETGKRCAIVYGGLPPETRAQQASLFNDPNNEYDFLVASDAIGMGLNLSIKRIIFETVRKYNGQERVLLSIPQIKQIAGRAGRYRTAQDDNKVARDAANPRTTLKSLPPKPQEQPKTLGLVTCLDEADLPVLQHALSTEGPPLKIAGILPPGEVYEKFAAQLPENTPFEYIMRRLRSVVATSTRFNFCNIRDQLSLARAIEKVPDLSIADRLQFCASPAPIRSGPIAKVVEDVLVALAEAVATRRACTIVDLPEIPLEVLDQPMSADRNYLANLEGLHKSLILYLWLSYRFPMSLRDQDMATQAKTMCEEKINDTLLKFSANPKLRTRLAEMRKSSELLSAQVRARGEVVDLPPMMNPDQTVEEIEAEVAGVGDNVGDQEGGGLEREIEVVGELDIGDERVVDPSGLRESGNVQQSRLSGLVDAAAIDGNRSEQRSAVGSG